jgi:hypothetical protein
VCEGRSVNQPTNGRQTIWDCTFLVTVFVLSCVPYVARLGFYSDDWDFVWSFHQTSDQSIAGLFKATYFDSAGWHLIRPGQIAYFVALYKAFGLSPLGYHVVNSLVLCAAVVELFLLCRALSVSRGTSIAIALVYGLAPHYSSDRFWFAASMANLSMALGLASLLCASRAQRCVGRPAAACQVCSVACMAASVLSYEITMPALALAYVLMWRGIWGRESRRAAANRAFVLITIVVFVGLFAFKVVAQHHTEWRLRFLRQLATVAAHAARQTLDFNFGSYLLLMPSKVLAIARFGAPRFAFALSGLIGVTVCAHLILALRTRGDEPSAFWRLGGAGLLVFGASYTMFAADPQLDLMTGPNNRIAAAAAVGAALCMIGLVGAITRVIVRDAAARGRVFAVGIALLCAAECLVVSTLAQSWVNASERQRAVLDDLRVQFPRPEAGTVILLDGECPYVGPGIVFEGNWDLAPALQMAYKNDHLDGDVLRRGAQVRADGIVVTVYGNETVHRYDRLLIVYDHRRRQTWVLSDFAAARRYFDVERSVVPCPLYAEGVGVRVF